MDILRIPTHYAMQITYMSESDKAYIIDAIMRLSIGEVFEIEKSIRGGVVLSIWTEAVQLENKASAKKGKSLKIDIAPMVQPMAHQDFKNVATNSNQINPIQTKSIQFKPNQDSSIEEGQQAVEIISGNNEIEKKEEFGNKEINEILELIKGQVEFLGFVYKKGNYERERAKNILTGKDFGSVCEKFNMSRAEFCKQIIYISSQTSFWSGKIYNAETLYKHYAQVLNSKKGELETQKRGVF